MDQIELLGYFALEQNKKNNNHFYPALCYNPDCYILNIHCGDKLKYLGSLSSILCLLESNFFY